MTPPGYSRHIQSYGLAGDECVELGCGCRCTCHWSNEPEYGWCREPSDTAMCPVLGHTPQDVLPDIGWQITQERNHHTMTYEEMPAPIAGEPLDAECAAQVLWMLNGEGIPPGSFRHKLYDAMAAADPTNLLRLIAAFPEEGKAWFVGTQVADGAARLRAAAGELAGFRGTDS